MFNANFNNISVISWQSVLLMEETGVPVKIIDLSQLTDKLYHIHFIEYISFELTTLVVIGTDCTGSWRSNYYAITTTAAPLIEVCYIYYIM